MAVKIRLLRMGKIRNPQYRIVVADARTKRDGKAIEFIGLYHPKEEPSLIQVNSERAQYWLSVGAQPSEPVLALLKKTGDWQKFKGEPAPEPLKVAAPRANKQEVYEAEAKAAAGLAEAAKAEKGKNDKKPAEKKSGKKTEAKADKPEGEASAEAVATEEQASADAGTNA